MKTYWRRNAKILVIFQVGDRLGFDSGDSRQTVSDYLAAGWSKITVLEAKALLGYFPSYGKHMIRT